MASTYSTSLRLELMATGDQSGTWGDTTNTNLGTLLEQAITGVLSVAQGDTTLTLTNLNGASDQARNAVVNLTGAMTAARNVVVPAPNKLYLVKNSTSGGFAITVKTPSGTGVTVPPGTARWVYADGTNVVDGMSGPWSPSSNDAQALGFSGTAWADLFLASGGVINWNAGDVTITHSANTLAFAGASSGYTFDAVISGTTASMTGTVTSTGSSVGFIGFQAVSTEAAAAAGPIIELYRNSASPTANDILGQVLFNGEDSAGNTQEYASIEAVIADATSTSEDGTLDFYAQIAGARTKIASMGPNLSGRGTTTNDSASAGFIGEYTSSAVTSGSAVSLTSGASANMTSMSLTAGDWDVSLNMAFLTAAGTNVKYWGASISESSGTLNQTPGRYTQFAVSGGTVPGSDDLLSATVGPYRLSLASTTTIYAVSFQVFTVSTLKSYGLLSARRVR